MALSDSGESSEEEEDGEDGEREDGGVTPEVVDDTKCELDAVGGRLPGLDGMGNRSVCVPCFFTILASMYHNRE